MINIYCILQTKLNALACVDRLLDSLDKMTVLEEVLPFMTEITCSDVDIIMAQSGQSVFRSADRRIHPFNSFPPIRPTRGVDIRAIKFTNKLE